MYDILDISLYRFIFVHLREAHQTVIFRRSDVKKYTAVIMIKENTRGYRGYINRRYIILIVMMAEMLSRQYSEIDQEVRLRD